VAWIKTFLAGLGAVMGALGTWWRQRQRAQALAEAQADADRIGADPVGEWLRRYNPDSAASAPPDTGKHAADE